MNKDTKLIKATTKSQTSFTNLLNDQTRLDGLVKLTRFLLHLSPVKQSKHHNY